jgi:hypothetical protein
MGIPEIPIVLGFRLNKGVILKLAVLALVATISLTLSTSSNAAEIRYQTVVELNKPTLVARLSTPKSLATIEGLAQRAGCLNKSIKMMADYTESDSFQEMIKMVRQRMAHNLEFIEIRFSISVFEEEKEANSTPFFRCSTPQLRIKIYERYFILQKPLRVVEAEFPYRTDDHITDSVNDALIAGGYLMLDEELSKDIDTLSKTEVVQ